jgi:DNA-binding NarL/FixJ family response regulator
LLIALDIFSRMMQGEIRMTCSHVTPSSPACSDGDSATREETTAPTGLGYDATLALGDIVVIERRALIRDCLAAALGSIGGCRVLPFQSAEEWVAAADRLSPSLILLGIAAAGRDLAWLRREISLIKQARPATPVVVLSQSEAAHEVLAAIEAGASGLIPANLPLPVAIQALRLVKLGGMYVPVDSLNAARQMQDAARRTSLNHRALTDTQAAVVQAIRRGKSNKAIACELDMRESTVKVHVRNIMKKFEAKNRTEIAIMANATPESFNEVRPAR